MTTAQRVSTATNLHMSALTAEDLQKNHELNLKNLSHVQYKIRVQSESNYLKNGEDLCIRVWALFPQG